MGQLSILHWSLLLAITVLFMYPYVRVIKRAGFSGWWILTMFVPIMNLIMIWVFAFAKWPAVDRA
ncbi:hypothetical protein PQQ78_00980 [Paraburkholderia sediminicola]